LCSHETEPLHDIDGQIEANAHATRELIVFQDHSCRFAKCMCLADEAQAAWDKIG
jgi:hypothetical protein